MSAVYLQESKNINPDYFHFYIVQENKIQSQKNELLSQVSFVFRDKILKHIHTYQNFSILKCVWICFRILSLKTNDTSAISWLFDFVSIQTFMINFSILSNKTFVFRHSKFLNQYSIFLKSCLRNKIIQAGHIRHISIQCDTPLSRTVQFHGYLRTLFSLLRLMKYLLPLT